MPTIQINLKPGASVFGVGGALMTAAGNPWTVDDEDAAEYVSRGVATYAAPQQLPSDNVLGNVGLDAQNRLVGPGGVVLDVGAVTVKSAQGAGPIIVAHRGGPHVEPEHTMSAYKACYASGIKYIEIDCWRLADGNVGIMHDTTVDRTTNGTGAVTSLTTAQFADLRVDSLSANSTAYPLEAPPLFSQVLDWAADRDVVIVAEFKHSEAVAPMLRDLESRGFPKNKFIFQSFESQPLLPLLADGWTCMQMDGGATTELIQEMYDKGLMHYGAPLSSWTVDEVNFAKSLGVRTWAYTADRRADLAAAISLGIDYIFTDDPVYLSGARVPLKSARFGAGRFMPGHVSSGTDGISPRGVFNADGTWSIGDATGASYQGSMMGFMCPIGGAGGLPASYTIEAEFTIVAVSGSDRWAGIMLNAALDNQFADTTGAKACHHILARQSGMLDVYSKLDGVATVRDARFTGSALTLGTKYKVTIAVTPTSITATLDNGATVTFNDARFRGGYFQLGSNGADVKWHSCVVS